MTGGESLLHRWLFSKQPNSSAAATRPQREEEWGRGKRKWEEVKQEVLGAAVSRKAQVEESASHRSGNALCGKLIEADSCAFLWGGCLPGNGRAFRSPCRIREMYQRRSPGRLPDALYSCAGIGFLSLSSRWFVVGMKPQRKWASGGGKEMSGMK